MFKCFYETYDTKVYRTRQLSITARVHSIANWSKFRKHRKKLKKCFFGFTKQTETNAKQILFRFVSIRTENFFFHFEDTLVCTLLQEFGQSASVDGLLFFIDSPPPLSDDTQRFLRSSSGSALIKHPPLKVGSLLSLRVPQCSGSLQRRWIWTGDFKCREVKTGFYRNRSMQTGSSGTLIGWKSGQTTFVPLWNWMEGAWLRTQPRLDCATS